MTAREVVFRLSEVKMAWRGRWELLLEIPSELVIH